MVNLNKIKHKIFFILQLVLISFLVSCKVYKPVAPTYSTGVLAENYINKYKDLAVSEMRRTGIPASITLAQGMLESDYGRSRLAKEANNHFGIKCHNDWTGPTIRHHDDKRNECFRKYRKPEDSFYDHSDFLKSGSRYISLFKIDPTDYKAWARGLKRAGYATNPDYANMLIRKIEDNRLYFFDNEKTKTGLSPITKKVTDKSAEVEESVNIEQVTPLTDGNISLPALVSRVKENNRIQYIIIKDGDTKEKLEKDFQLLRWELTKYNEVKGDLKLVPGQILYLQPKRDKSEPGKEYHNCTEGETMYMISQKYGIRLKSLLEMNRMEEGREPVAGQKIWLRVIKPVN
jgi:LysM repeat protein